MATKVSGIYGLIRLSSDVFPPSAQLDQVFLVVGAVSIVVGAFAAIGQTDMKRLLAHSSISQVGYIILGLGAGPIGVIGATFHLFNHAIFKSLLFVTSSALEKQVGTTDMNKMGGLDNRMRITSATGLLAMLYRERLRETRGVDEREFFAAVVATDTFKLGLAGHHWLWHGCACERHA